MSSRFPLRNRHGIKPVLNHFSVHVPQVWIHWIQPLEKMNSYVWKIFFFFFNLKVIQIYSKPVIQHLHSSCLHMMMKMHDHGALVCKKHRSHRCPYLIFAPSHLSEVLIPFIPPSPLHSLNFCSFPRSINKSVSYRAFFDHATYLWSKLPLHITEPTSITIFKTHIFVCS